METIAKIFLVVLFGVVAVVGLGLLAALPVMWLWNAVAVDVLGVSGITFLQAWGLLVLSGLLFKSHGTASSTKG